MKMSQTATPNDPYCRGFIKELEGLGYRCTNYYHEVDYGCNRVQTLRVTDKRGKEVYVNAVITSTLLVGKEAEHAKQDALRNLYRDALHKLSTKVKVPNRTATKIVVDNWWR